MNNVQNQNQVKTKQYLHMGEWSISDSENCELVISGLGSCIALCLYEPILKIGAMAHIVLPSTSSRNIQENSTLIFENYHSARYADEAVDILIKAFESISSFNIKQKTKLKAKLAGGSQMFSGESQLNKNKNQNIKQGFPTIGTNNINSVINKLENVKIPIISSDLGGNNGRTVNFDIQNGMLYIKKIGLNEKIII